METDQAIITTQDLVFSWQRQQSPVVDIDAFSIQAGERVFIKGPSGSGKSTLLSLLGGVLVPQRGHVSVLGKELGSLSGAQRDVFRADHIGFIFQMFNLIPYLSVLDNVYLPLQFSRQRRDKVLARGGIQEEAIRLLAHLDLDSEDVLSRPVTELSVGQQQRVAAARALIGSPEILIADEPTSSLDADRREAFIALLIRECAQAQITLVFVSHDAGLEAYFDRSIALDDINRAALTTRREEMA